MPNKEERGRRGPFRIQTRSSEKKEKPAFRCIPNLASLVVSPTVRYRCSASARLMMLGIFFSHATQMKRMAKPVTRFALHFSAPMDSSAIDQTRSIHSVLAVRGARQQGRCSKDLISIHKQDAGSVNSEFRKRGPTTQCWFPFFLGTRFACSILTCCGPAKREGTRSFIEQSSADQRAKQSRSHQTGGMATPLASEMSPLLVHRPFGSAFGFSSAQLLLRHDRQRVRSILRRLFLVISNEEGRAAHGAGIDISINQAADAAAARENSFVMSDALTAIRRNFNRRQAVWIDLAALPSCHALTYAHLAALPVVTLYELIRSLDASLDHFVTRHCELIEQSMATMRCAFGALLSHVSFT